MKEYNITFITGNQGKAEYLSDYFHINVARAKLDLREIQSLNLREIVENKARQAFDTLKKPVLVEDVSLIIHALGRLPGPFIKWFLKELQPEGICNLVLNKENKSATAQVCYWYHDGVSVQLFPGAINGSIAPKAVGENGFGWDKIFITEGYQITRAQMETEDYEKTSPRKIALKNFEEYLK